MKRVVSILGLVILLASFAFATSIRIETLPDGVRMQPIGFGLSSDEWSNSEPSITIRALQNGITPLAVVSPPVGNATTVGKLKTMSGEITFAEGFLVRFTVSTNDDPFVNIIVGCVNSSTSAIACNFNLATPVAPGAYSSTSLSYNAGMNGPATPTNAVRTTTGIQANGYLNNVLDLTTPTLPSTLTTTGPGSASQNNFVTNGFAARTDITTMNATFTATVGPRGNTGTVTSFNAGGVYSLNPVPEPGTFAMLGLGLLGFAFAVRRRAN